MIKRDLTDIYNKLSKYSELRLQENRTAKMIIEDGDLVANDKSSIGGVSARVFKDGVWGFASRAEFDDDAIEYVIDKARFNAQFLASKSQLTQDPYETEGLKISKDFSTTKKRWSQDKIITYLKSVDDYIEKTYPDLISRTIYLNSFEIEKRVITSDGTDSYSLWPRVAMDIIFTVLDGDDPIELTISYGGLGNFEDYLTTVDDLKDDLENLYQSIQKKRNSVYTKAGTHDVILDADITGLLAHEAMGHTAEADYVRKGSIAGENLDNKVASSLISLYDFAHTYNNGYTPNPMLFDDEGVLCKDAPIIEKGILKSLMHNRDSAYDWGCENRGNGRAYQFYDEPNIRMRNTAILPGESKLADMIASIEDGYYFKSSLGGEADITGEFMFGISEGYEIKNGKLGKAIKDTTISGIAFEVLSSVTMVSDQFRWTPGGWCFRKTLIPVGMGGPAIKCRVNVGGR